VAAINTVLQPKVECAYIQNDVILELIYIHMIAAFAGTHGPVAAESWS